MMDTIYQTLRQISQRRSQTKQRLCLTRLKNKIILLNPSNGLSKLYSSEGTISNSKWTLPKSRARSWQPLWYSYVGSSLTPSASSLTSFGGVASASTAVGFLSMKSPKGTIQFWVFSTVYIALLQKSWTKKINWIFIVNSKGKDGIDTALTLSNIE